MASLHKDPRGRSPFWYCAFTHADGTRSFKSTKKTKRKEAEAVCDGWQRAVDLSHAGTLTEVQARKVLSEIYERANTATIEFQTTAQFLRDWIESKKMTTAPGTSRRYRDTVEGFIKHLGVKSERGLGAATPSDVLTYRDLQLAQGKSNKTANMEIKTLRIAFNMARKQGLILTNPAEAVEMLPEMSVAREPFTRQQITELLKVADREWRGMILLGTCHGLRLGDTLELLALSHARYGARSVKVLRAAWRVGKAQMAAGTGHFAPQSVTAPDLSVASPLRRRGANYGPVIKLTGKAAAGAMSVFASPVDSSRTVSL
jgi:hypothetical protein